MTVTSIIEYTIVGTTTWTVPFGCISATFTAIGGGGSGQYDTGSDQRGHGGGGAGFARATYSVAQGEVFEIKVGGGATVWPNNGTESYVKKTGGTSVPNPLQTFVFAAGGYGSWGQQSTGSFFASNAQAGTGVVVEGGAGELDDNGGRGGRAGNPITMNPAFRVSDGRGGYGTNLDGTENLSSYGDDGAYFGGGGCGNTNGNTNYGAGGQGAVRIEIIYAEPQINTFYASPNPQTSGTSGIASSNTVFFWTSTYADDLSISNGVGPVAQNGSKPYTTGLQSITGVNSPASETYTLTANGPGGSVTQSITFSVYNDNTPLDFEVPSLLGVEPNTQYTITTPPITDIDMIIAVTGSTGVTVSTNNANFSSTVYASVNSTIYARVTSLSFNTDPKGLVNNKECYIDFGSIRKYFNVVTRAPNVEELFDYGNDTSAFPYPDIDIITNTPTQYIVSPTTLTVDDVELSNPNGTEITADLPDAQVRVKSFGSTVYGSWLYVRELTGFIPGDPFNPGGPGSSPGGGGGTGGGGSTGPSPFYSLTTRDSGTITNPTPNKFNTRFSGTLTAANISPNTQ